MYVQVLDLQKLLIAHPTAHQVLTETCIISSQ